MSKKIDFERVLQEIGEFGLYQKVNYVLLCLPVIFAAANSLTYVFTAASPNYRCFVPNCDKPTGRTHFNQPWLHLVLPGKRSAKGVFMPDPCHRYKSQNHTSIYFGEYTCPDSLFMKHKKERCYDFVYETVERTIVHEWMLQCPENNWKLALVGTVHSAGLVFGTALSGYLADRYGRKMIFITCIVFMGLTGFGQSVTYDYISFLVLGFLNAVGTSGVYPLAFIISMEMVGVNKREFSSILLNYFYALGEAAVGLLAWCLMDWRLLQMVASLPSLIFIGYYWVVPESIRWLIARNDRAHAGYIIRKAAEINGRQLSNELTMYFDMSNANLAMEDCESNISTDSYLKDVYPRKPIMLAIRQVFASNKIWPRYMVMLYIWAVNAVVYYGLSLNSVNINGNKFLNFTLVCLIEIPGYTLAWAALRWLGRRLTLGSSMIICGITCILSTYLTNITPIIQMVLFLAGKLGITISFAVIYAYTTELIPTIIRSGGVGIMSMFARFGAMVAPFVPLLAKYSANLPMLTFGICSFTAGLIGFVLPETFNKKLPDNVMDVEILMSKK